MDYRRFVKRFDVGTIAETLTYEDVVARAITRADLEEDVRGINASLDIIRRTRGGQWPTEAVTEEGNFVDLVWHEVEFRDGIPSHMPCMTRTADISVVAICTRWAGAPS